MATLVTLTQVNQAIANARTMFVITVQNTGSSALTLSSAQVSEATESECTISQPNILTTNVALGAGNPTIGAGSSVSFSFPVVFQAPNTAGVSPNAPGPLGVSGMALGQPADPTFVLQAQVQTSDGAVASTSLVVSALSATAPFPRPEGGALQFSQGSNLINGIIMGVL